jgi:hypothetical protein
MHALNLASLLAPGGDLQVTLHARWYGLRGRQLVSFDSSRIMFGEHVSNQDVYETSTTVDVNRVLDNLPEIVSPLLRPLYERFQFFRLPDELAAEELMKMRNRRNYF